MHGPSSANSFFLNNLFLKTNSTFHLFIQDNFIKTGNYEILITIFLEILIKSGMISKIDTLLTHYFSGGNSPWIYLKDRDGSQR